jgi:hypothetical protein
MSKHPKTPKQNPHPKPHEDGRDDKSTKRHVYIEPGAKVNFVEDLRDEYRTANTETSTHNNKQLLLSSATIILLLITSGFTFWQGFSTKRAADATTKAADVASAQFHITQIDEQPWLGVLPQGEPIIVPKAAPVMTVVVTNTGKTPALDIAGNYYVEILKIDEVPHYEARVAHIKTMQFSMIPPNGAREEVIPRWRHKPGAPIDEGEPDPLTDSEKKALGDGTAYIAVHGVIWYGDMFKQKRHWTRFCYWKYFAKKTYFDARACDAHNSAGDE